MRGAGLYAVRVVWLVHALGLTAMMITIRVPASTIHERLTSVDSCPQWPSYPTAAVLGLGACESVGG